MALNFEFSMQNDAVLPNILVLAYFQTATHPRIS